MFWSDAALGYVNGHHNRSNSSGNQIPCHRCLHEISSPFKKAIITSIVSYSLLIINVKGFMEGKRFMSIPPRPRLRNMRHTSLRMLPLMNWLNMVKLHQLSHEGFLYYLGRSLLNTLRSSSNEASNSAKSTSS